MKMILADDESVITAGIQKLIDWKTLGIEIVGVYEDGRSAFEGIVREQPDLALLDISMPGMDGIRILKECSHLKCKTKVIFISGFQDFEYAKAAVKYGAVDYLLKPIIREELTAALEKCISGTVSRIRREREAEPEEQRNGFEKLIQLEETSYIPAVVMLPRYVKDEKMKKLLIFSVTSFLEEHLERQKKGIVFLRHDDIVLVLKGMEQKACTELLDETGNRAEETIGQKLYFIQGKLVEHISEIRAAYEECLSMRGYQFFTDRIAVNVLRVGEPVFGTGDMTSHRFGTVREAMITSAAELDRTAFENYYSQFDRLVCRMADGKKEDACFYFCSAARMIKERLKKSGVLVEDPEGRLLLELGRKAVSYSELADCYHEQITADMDQAAAACRNVSSEIQNFEKARAYIETHYAEELSLQVLADHVHMNPYYFSAFFKKNAGENFKSYLNNVRLKHAVALLLSTDKKNIEIAMETGFSDARSFSDIFQRTYHETPAEYRRRIRKKG